MRFSLHKHTQKKQHHRRGVCNRETVDTQPTNIDSQTTKEQTDREKTRKSEKTCRSELEAQAQSIKTSNNSERETFKEHLKIVRNMNLPDLLERKNQVELQSLRLKHSMHRLQFVISHVDEVNKRAMQSGHQVPRLHRVEFKLWVERSLQQPIIASMNLILLKQERSKQENVANIGTTMLRMFDRSDHDLLRSLSPEQVVILLDALHAQFALCTDCLHNCDEEHELLHELIEQAEESDSQSKQDALSQALGLLENQDGASPRRSDHPDPDEAATDMSTDLAPPQDLTIADVLMVGQGVQQRREQLRTIAETQGVLRKALTEIRNELQEEVSRRDASA